MFGFKPSKEVVIKKYMAVANDWNNYCAYKGNMWHLGDMGDINRIKELDRVVSSYRSVGEIDVNVLNESIKLMESKML